MHREPDPQYRITPLRIVAGLLVIATYFLAKAVVDLTVGCDNQPPRK